MIWYPWEDSLNIGTLDAGTTKEVLIQGMLASGTIGNVENTATVSSTNADPDQDSELVRAVAEADIYVTKAGAPQPVFAGQRILYSMLVGNNGPSDAEEVMLFDSLPAEIINPQASIDFGTFMPVTSIYAVNLGILVAGQNPVSVRIRGTVDTSAFSDIVNEVLVTTTTTDPISSNNMDSFTSTVNTNADLKITKTVNEDPIPAGMTNPEYSFDGGATWEPWTESICAPAIPSGTMETVLIKGVADASVQGQQLENMVVISSETPDPDLSNNSSSFVTVPNGGNGVDLAITKAGTLIQHMAILPICNIA